jgi:hypothetical protein
MNELSLPTPAQETKFFILCQNFTVMYRFINLTRLDERTGEILMLVGEETAIIIDRDGTWRVVQ